jgi:ankyrin repeat protein
VGGIAVATKGSTGTDSCTALQQASHQAITEAISRSLASGQSKSVASWLSKDLTTDQRAIAMAVATGDLQKAAKRIQQTKDNLVFGLHDSSGDTLLNSAAWKGYVDVVKALLNKGVGADSTLDASAAEGRAGSTALIAALDGGLQGTLQNNVWGERKLSVIKTLLQAGANPNARDLSGRSPLSTLFHWWPGTGSDSSVQEQALQALLAAGADINARSELGPTAAMAGRPGVPAPPQEPRATALSDAIRRPNPGLVQILLQHGADPRSQDSIALAAAVEVGDKDNVVVLLHQGASPNAREYGAGGSMLARAIVDTRREPYRTIALTLISAGSDPNAGETSGVGLGPPILAAMVVGDQELVALLLSKGADPNAGVQRAAENPQTLLEWALMHEKVLYKVTFNRSVYVRLLLNAGADPNRHTAGSRMPLDLTQDDEPDVIAMLLDKGARLELVVLPNGERIGPITDKIRAGRTVLPMEMLRRAKWQLGRDERYALLTAVAHENTDVVRVLLEHNARPDARGPQGETALHLAAMRGNVALVDLLITAGADPNARTGLANEVLAATMNGPPQMAFVASLMSKESALGFLPAMPDGRLTPLMLAAVDGGQAVVQLLLQKGARPELRSEHGMTAAEFARRHGADDIYDMLTAASKNR